MSISFYIQIGAFDMRTALIAVLLVSRDRAALFKLDIDQLILLENQYKKDQTIKSIFVYIHEVWKKLILYA